MRSIAPDTVAQLMVLYGVINKAGGIVTTEHVAEVMPFGKEERNQTATGSRLNYFVLLGFLVKLPPTPDQHQGASRYAVNPDKRGFLEYAYTRRESNHYALEDAIVQALNRRPMILSKLVEALPLLPSECGGFPDRKARADRVQKTVDDLIRRRVLQDGPAGYFVRGGGA